MNIVHNGVTYWLGKLPPDPIKRAAFAPVTDAIQVLPRSQWRELNRRTVFGSDFMLDQRSHGSCVGFSAAHAMMRTRAIEGRSFQRLSGAYIYSKINGGRDNGAAVSDGLNELQKNGVCLESEAGWDAIYPNQYPASANQTAARFKVTEAYRVDTFDQMVSALLLGFIAVGAVMVGNRFANVDSNGVAGFDQGPGNHSVCFDGVHQLPSGEWTVDLPNTWGLSVGVDGRFYITQRHFESVQQDSYVIRQATIDPQDVNNPPLVGG